MNDFTALFTTTPEANAAFGETVQNSLPSGWIPPLASPTLEKKRKPAVKKFTSR